MKRKGVSGYVIVAITFFLFIMQFMMAAAYASMVMEQAEDQVAESFRRAASAEKLLTASCATKSRGVFYATAVESGDFRCVWPLNNMYVRFEADTLSGNQSQWMIERESFNPANQDFRIFVRDMRNLPQMDDFYQVTIYNRSTKQTHPAIMGVTAQWPAELVS